MRRGRVISKRRKNMKICEIMTAWIASEENEINLNSRLLFAVSENQHNVNVENLLIFFFLILEFEFPVSSSKQYWSGFWRSRLKESASSSECSQNEWATQVEEWNENEHKKFLFLRELTTSWVVSMSTWCSEHETSVVEHSLWILIRLERPKNDNNRNWFFYFLQLNSSSEISDDFWTLSFFILPKFVYYFRDGEGIEMPNNMKYDYWLYNSFFSHLLTIITIMRRVYMENWNLSPNSGEKFVSFCNYWFLWPL